MAILAINEQVTMFYIHLILIYSFRSIQQLAITHMKLYGRQKDIHASCMPQILEEGTQNDEVEEEEGYDEVEDAEEEEEEEEEERGSFIHLVSS